MSFSEFFTAGSALGDAFKEGRDRAEATRLLDQQLTAALGTQQAAPVALSPLGTPIATGPRAPTFAATGGALGSYLDTVRGKESGGNDFAQNPNSTAKGIDQFTAGTWAGLMRKYPQLGLTADGRTDREQSTRAMQAFTKDNADALSRAGVPITPGNLYVSHFLGEAGGPRFIAGAMSNPDAPATAFVTPGAAAANKSIFYNRDGSPKRAGDVYAERTSKFGGDPIPTRAASTGGQPTMTLPGMGAPAMPTQVAQADADAADMPTPNAQPVSFQIPGSGAQSDFVPGTVASPVVQGTAVPQAAQATGLAPAAAQRLSPDQVTNLRAMLRNPNTQGYAAKIVEGLNKPSEFSFQVVGDQLIRTSKDGRAEVVPNITKPATLSVVKGSDGNDYIFNPQTGTMTRGIEGRDKQFTDLINPAERAAAGVDPTYKGAVQRGPDGQLHFPGKAPTEISLTSEKAQDSTIGKAYGETFNDLQSGARGAVGQLNTLRLMEKLVDNPNFYSGTQSGAFLAAKRAAASFGLKGAEDIAAPNELFGKLATQSLLDKAGGSLGAGISNLDVATLNRTIANPENTKEGNRQIIQFGKALAQRQIDVARLARQYAGAHGGRLDAGFDDQLSAWAEKNPLNLELTPLQKQAQEAEARGVPAPAGPQAAPTQPQGGLKPLPADTLSEARDAIRRGAPAAKVIERLRSQGFDAGGL